MPSPGTSGQLSEHVNSVAVCRHEQCGIGAVVKTPDSPPIQILGVRLTIGACGDGDIVRSGGGENAVDGIENRGMTRLVRDSEVGRQVHAADLDEVRGSGVQQVADAVDGRTAFDLDDEGGVPRL